MVHCCHHLHTTQLDLIPILILIATPTSIPVPVLPLLEHANITCMPTKAGDDLVFLPSLLASFGSFCEVSRKFHLHAEQLDRLLVLLAEDCRLPTVRPLVHELQHCHHLLHPTDERHHQKHHQRPRQQGPSRCCYNVLLFLLLPLPLLVLPLIVLLLLLLLLVLPTANAATTAAAAAAVVWALLHPANQRHREHGPRLVPRPAALTAGSDQRPRDRVLEAVCRHSIPPRGIARVDDLPEPRGSRQTSQKLPRKTAASPINGFLGCPKFSELSELSDLSESPTICKFPDFQPFSITPILSSDNPAIIQRHPQNITWKYKV